MRSLCEKAPEAARSLANMILEYSDTNGGTQDVTGGPQQLWEDVEDKAAKSVRHKGYSYRSLKSAKAKVKKDDPLGKLDL